MGYRGMYGRERTFQPDMQRAMEDCKGRVAHPGADWQEFTPQDILGLVDWHRADMGVTLVGSKVSAWADLSGNGHHLSQSTDANRPTYIPNVIGGQPVLRFGTDLAFSYAALWPASQTTTIFAVIKMVTNSGAAYQITLQTNSGTPNLYLGGITANGSADKPLLFYISERAVQPGALTNGNPYLVKWGMDLTAATIFWYSQVNSGTETSSNAAGGPAFPGNWQTLGIIGAGQSCLSDIAELIVYNRRLPPEEDAKVRSYISTRYGIVM